jgi:hypothetical protein
MAVNDNDLVNAAVNNASNMSRNTDTDTTGKLDLLNSAPESGPSIIGVQQGINELFEATGLSGVGDLNLNQYASNTLIADGQSLKQAVETIDQAFESGGHNHDGTLGSGGQVSANSLADFNKYFAEWQLLPQHCPLPQ